MLQLNYIFLVNEYGTEGGSGRYYIFLRIIMIYR